MLTVRLMARALCSGRGFPSPLPALFRVGFIDHFSVALGTYDSAAPSFRGRHPTAPLTPDDVPRGRKLEFMTPPTRTPQLLRLRPPDRIMMMPLAYERVVRSR